MNAFQRVSDIVNMVAGDIEESHDLRAVAYSFQNVVQLEITRAMVIDLRVIPTLEGQGEVSATVRVVPDVNDWRCVAYPLIMKEEHFHKVSAEITEFVEAWAQVGVSIRKAQKVQVTA